MHQLALSFALRLQGGMGRRSDPEGLSSLMLRCCLLPEKSKLLSPRHFSGGKEKNFPSSPNLLSFKGRLPDMLNQYPALFHPPGHKSKQSQGIGFDSSPWPPSPVGGHTYSFKCPKGFLLPPSIYWCSCHISPGSSLYQSRSQWETDGTLTLR